MTDSRKKLYGQVAKLDKVLMECRFLSWKVVSLALVFGGIWRGKSILGGILIGAGVLVGVGPGCRSKDEKR